MTAASAAAALNRGDLAAARLLIDALALREPAALPLRLKLAVALLARGALVEALTRLEALVRDVPESPSAWQALGAARREADDAAGAAAAFARVLRLTPGDPNALRGAAMAAADLGRPALQLWQAALKAAPTSSAARTGLAAMLAGDGDPDAATAVLRHRLTAEPGWREGWETLLTLQYRWHGRDTLAVVAREAFDARPRDAALMLDLLRTLARTGHHAMVLTWAAEMRARVGDSAPLRLVEAEALDALGERKRAAALFEALATTKEPVVELARVRHALRCGRPDVAAQIAALRARGPDRGVWLPYLGSAWRMIGDSRWAWLEGDPRLVGSYRLGLSASELEALAARLRSLHAGRFPPFQQSMRGGTQTEGNLLGREEPEIRHLRGALQAAVANHLAQLPPSDSAHPTLGLPRGPSRFTGSWSVRLEGGGHHVNHVHTQGWFSSAAYVTLPPAMAAPIDESEPYAGWLALGEPPVELATGLAPVRWVRPVAGEVTLFPSTMWHGTAPFAAGERLTVAFDVVPLV